MELRRLLPYLVGLFVLAFALGSVSRGSAGGSLLFGSFWLLYLVYLVPVFLLGVMVVIVVLVALNWREIGAGLGLGMARSRQARKKKSPYPLIISIFMWALAIVVLIDKPGTLLNPFKTNSTNIIKTEITGTNGSPPNPLQAGGFVPAISNIIQNTWFSIAFFALLVVGGAVLIESYRTSFRTTSHGGLEDQLDTQVEGLRAVHEAIKLVDDPNADPREKIITCYQRLIITVSNIGIATSPDMTARELERSIRTALLLKGKSVNELTQLFEEARYSLHEIVDDDVIKARDYLESIKNELRAHLAHEI